MSEGTWDAMLRDEEARGLTDRIALAHELLELAGRFELEAQQWTHDSMRHTRRNLLESGRVLEIYGRSILGDSQAITRDVAESYRDAALVLLKATITKRRRLTQITTTRRHLDAAIRGDI